MAERGSPPPAKSAVFLSLYEIPLELDHGDDIAVAVAFRMYADFGALRPRRSPSRPPRAPLQGCASRASQINLGEIVGNAKKCCMLTCELKIT